MKQENLEELLRDLSLSAVAKNAMGEEDISDVLFAHGVFGNSAETEIAQQFLKVFLFHSVIPSFFKRIMFLGENSRMLIDPRGTPSESTSQSSVAFLVGLKKDAPCSDQLEFTTGVIEQLSPCGVSASCGCTADQ